MGGRLFANGQLHANALAEKHLESLTLSENAPVRVWRQAYQQFKTKGGDAFTPLGEDAESDPTLPGELAYVDDAGAVCRRWNWREGVRGASHNQVELFRTQFVL